MILLACAVEAELALLEAARRRRTSRYRRRAGRGLVRAHAPSSAGSPYRLVVNAGLAGAFDGAAGIGDGVVVDR